MFTLLDHAANHTCQGYSRREFLRVGALGLGGLALPQLLAARAASASSPLTNKAVRDKSVILLFLQGGPPHIECFDPKMSAPSDIRAMFGEVKTKLPGVTFGSHFPKMAALADKLAIVRSYGSKNNDHKYDAVVTAANPLKASASAIYSRVAGTNHPDTGMPSNVLITPEAVSEKIKLGRSFETDALPTLTQPGQLGATYAAFNPAGGGTIKQNMELRIDPSRLMDRRHLLTGLDRLRRDAESTNAPDPRHAVDKYQQQAFDIITRGVGDAFDWSREDARTIARYDTSKQFNLADVHRWYDMGRASNLLGHQLLMARRLCEAGCGFVTVSDCGWDLHSNSNSPKNLGGMHWLAPQVDHAVAAFIEDIHARGLQDKILLIITGEMGRSPRINKDGGRDHYGELTSLIFAGGGLKMGQAIGQSDRIASKPDTEPYTPANLAATIFNVLFDPSELRLQTNMPREILQMVENGKPIRELF
jgi:hypothetical protein